MSFGGVPSGLSHRASLSGAPSVSSGGLDGAANGKKVPFPKSNIEVNLKNHFGSKIYTSGSPLSGDVTITTKRDVRFDSIQILLVGSTQTKTDGLNSLNLVTHTFLKLVMPIPESTYPVPRVLETGQTITIPFNFVIPNHLTISACNHERLSGQLQDQHLLLPPSLGGWDKDDMSPIMARIDYSIKARVLRQADVGSKMVRIMEATQPIRVLPASAEDPPLNISAADKLYKMTKSKTVRKNLMATRVGQLTAEALQPSAALLQSNGLGIASHPLAQVSLTFEPTSADVASPRVTGVSGKIISHTFYSSGTIASFPNLGTWSQPFDVERRGVYSASTPLPSMKVSHTPWAQRPFAAAVRRDSGYSSDVDGNCGQEGGFDNGKKSSKAASTSPIYHTTTLEIPFKLPSDKKMFIPTFHSCLASRVYTLQLSLDVTIGSTRSNVSLTMPLQVGIEYSTPEQHGVSLPSFETAVAEAEADAHLQPRVIRVPEYEFNRDSSALPGYGTR
ncbi:hypothetical protein B0T26DRAFT_646004 [Lasiosphaeria miniovina]|uniref:Arrestin n=1 Tax=Lasiosphaeria miniovina TaxID=1954250 RepID=A0AA40ALP7_9PEZI|nr:uncharacterized protein B0T26DRAFT_646004 [Lasiosphaeria miniovina]KAK0718156.1 hypothetical protein B0T26DRAFT_646004 [Lasiosphaeria miniovina]